MFLRLVFATCRGRAASLCVVAVLVLTRAPLCQEVPEVPSGSILQIRLDQSVSSNNSRAGDAIHAVLISPWEVQGSILLPAGTEVLGTVTHARKVGLGFVHEKATLELNFHALVLPDGARKPIKAKVVEVDNARESVNSEGRIEGVRATASYGSKATGFITGVAEFDPLLALFAFSGSTMVLRFPEPEVWYPAGTEINLELQQPVIVERPFSAPLRPVAANDEEKSWLTDYVAELPFQTMTLKTGTPSDITNLLFLGSEEEINRAFTAAGWTTSDEFNSTTAYNTAMALAQDRAYRQGPMSVLLLDEHPPHVSYQKNLNTFAKRHHLRVWHVSEPWMTHQTWMASATHDVGIGLSKQSTRLTHLVDANVDNERSKVINDLVFTNCVDAVQLIDRPHVPRSTRNGSGDRLFTDGRIAVIQLNACDHPRLSNQMVDDAVPRHGRAVGHAVRQFDLTLRNTLLRDNVGWQAYSGSRSLVRALHHGGTRPAPMATEGENEEERPAFSATPAKIGIAADLAPYPGTSEVPRRGWSGVEFSLDGGLSLRRFLGDVFLETYDPVLDVTDVLEFPLRIESGAAISPKIVIHAQRRFSHEISYNFLQANLRIGGTDVAEKDRLRIRQIGYALETQLAPARFRIRPFLLAGPTFTSFSLKNASVPKSDAVFQFVLRTAGPVLNAFNAAGVAPLDGGTVFRAGVDYGAGCRIRLTDLLNVRVEYRENFSADPDFFNRQSAHFSDQGIYTSQDPGSSRHSAITVGMAFHP